jgi:AraC-like DNA-binding protein
MGIISVDIIPETVYFISEHQNTWWEILYYTQGSGFINIKGEDIPFHSGDIMCIPPNTPHYEYSQDGHCNFYLFLDSVAHLTEFRKFKDTLNRNFMVILSLLHKEYHFKRQSNWKMISNGLLGVLEQYIISFESGGKYNPLVEELANILTDNLSNKDFKLNETLKSFSFENNYSGEYLRKLFRKEIGETPLAYLSERRIEYAKQLLKNRYSNKITIKQIALLTGFGDPYYFSRVFKKMTGKSPTEWV